MSEPSSVWSHLNLRGLIPLAVSAAAGAAVSHYKEQGELDWFPDWGFDVVLIFMLLLGVYWLWTHKDIRSALHLIYDRRPKMLTPILILAGCLLGGGFGAFGAWRISKYRQQHPLKRVPQNSETGRMLSGLRSFLIPANDPTPPNACDKVLSDDKLLSSLGIDRASMRTVLIGSAASVFKATLKPFSVIRIADEDLLTIEPAHTGIVLSAILRDENNALIATITKNVYKPYASNDYEVTSDEHSVLILNAKDQVVLYVRYINPQAIKVMGIFRAPEREPVIIEEGKITVGGSTFSGFCSAKPEFPSGIFRIK